MVKKKFDRTRLKSSTKLNLGLSLIILLAGVVSIVTLDWRLKSYARGEAREKAMILLDRNLATHTYFSHQLKPVLFDKMKPFMEETYFEPIWMSSTYAVREIDKYYHSLTKKAYYYKEAAINARSPANEADAFEREFIKELNTSSDLSERIETKTVDGKPFFIVLRRGEVMERSCLRCHSTPGVAPADMVANYGPERSFHRSEGETVSAVSIRIPLAQAYENINHLIYRLSTVFAATLATLIGLSIYLGRLWVFNPLTRIRRQTAAISRNPENLGQQIDMPSSRELAELTKTFNIMSVRLRQERDLLESRVAERTEKLNGLNFKLEKEVDEHKKTISELQVALSEVKTLRGIFPICSHCKKIRSDEGYWDQIESYIKDHSEADFSHSICPDCAKRHYPEYDLYGEDEKS